MPCVKCGKDKFYPSATKYNRNKENLFKIVNSKKYELLYCEKCLEQVCLDYTQKNRGRIFNSLNNVSMIAFGIPNDEIVSANRSHAISLCKFVEKYGEILGAEKWKDYRTKLSRKNTLEFHIEKYGNEKGKQKYEEYCKNKACTEKNFIRRFGEQEGKQRWEEYREKQSYSESLEYCIEKFGEDGFRIYKERCKNKALKKERFVEKYGEKDGLCRWEVYRKKYIESFAKRSPHSKKAQSFFDKLKESIHSENLTFFDSSTSEKFFIKKGRFASADFYIPEIDLVIEYYGDFWHANPSVYCAEDKIHTSYCAKDIWERDKRRLEIFGSSSVVVVWELDANDDKIKELTSVIHELRNRNR